MLPVHISMYIKLTLNFKIEQVAYANRINGFMLFSIMARMSTVVVLIPKPILAIDKNTYNNNSRIYIAQN